MTEDEKLKVLHDDTQRYKQIAHEIRSFMNRTDPGRFCRAPLHEHLHRLHEMIGAELIRLDQSPTAKRPTPKES